MPDAIEHDVELVIPDDEPRFWRCKACRSVWRSDVRIGTETCPQVSLFAGVETGLGGVVEQ